VQHSIRVLRVLNDPVFCALKKLPDYRLGEPLLDPVTRGVILEGRHRNSLPFGRQISRTPRNVIAASHRRQCRNQ
jgi:hypothetical protein